MYYYRARYYAPPTFISRDPLFEEKPWINPYTYCANSPINKIDPTGLFDKEAQAEKSKAKAIKRYGEDRVGSVTKDENGEYYFKVYGKETVTSNNDGNGNTLSNTNVIADRGTSIYSKRGLKLHTKQNKINPTTMEKIGDAVRNFEERFMDAAIPVVQGAVLLNPLVGIANDIKTLAKGEDIYGNKAKAVDKVVAGVDIVTLGGAKAVKYVGQEAAKVMNYINKLTTGYSVGKTIYEESKKN
jgi:hypothetical protein